MATLTGNSVQSTYDSLIKIGDNTSGFATLKQLSDGLGNLMPIQFSSTVVDFQTATDVNFTGVNVIGISTSDTTYDLTSAQSTNDVNLNLTPSIGGVDTVKLVAGTNVTLTDNGSNQITIDASPGSGGVTSLEGLTGALDLVGTQNLTVTDNGSNTITLTGYDDTPVTTNAANIATNTTDIATNAADISNNTNDITQNETDIATNTAGIASNLVLIGANLASINTNANNITSANGNITTNANNISTNAGNIATNTSDISLLDADVVANGASITDLENGVGTVKSFNTLAGDVTISAGTNITLTPVGQDIEISAASGGTPGGANTQIQFNNAGAFGGDADFTYDSSTSTLSLRNSSIISYSGKFKPAPTDLTDPVSGEIHPQAGSGLTAGIIYYMDGTSWTVADNTDIVDASRLLGMAVSATELMIRGFYSNTTYAGLTPGRPIYLSANGAFTQTPTTTISEFIRCVGYADIASTRAIYFNPSTEFYEVG